MSQSWKAHERSSAALVGGIRYAANTGGRVDVESSWAVGQCKNVARMSLTEASALCQEMERIGRKRNKIGVLIVKQRAGQGKWTPDLVMMTAAMFREMSGHLPGEEETDATDHVYP